MSLLLPLPFLSKFRDRFSNSQRRQTRNKRRLISERLESRVVMAATPIITEFLASNSGGLDDSDGESSDWIEVSNPTGDAIDLSGWTLTDDADELDQWTFPNTTLGANESLVVFASGKDRTIADAELHTNFKLSSGGEYLALVDPGGTIAQAFAPEYPSQSTNVSYGLISDVQTLVQSDDPASTFIPTNGTLGNSWQLPGFNDAGWIDGPVGVGYGLDQPGFDVRYVKANTSVGTNGQVNSLALAESVLANPSFQSLAVNEQHQTINFYGTGAAANFGNDSAFPTQELGQDFNDFVIEASATVNIPNSGNWSFGVNSDDGFGLSLSRNGVTYESSFDGTRGPEDTIGIFNLPDAGEYDLRLVMFERTGGASVELFAAPGSVTNFSNAFDLVGDVASGGLQVFSDDQSSDNPLVNTDIESAMSGSSSAYVRIPFQVDDAEALASLDLLSLNMNYQDGFVAWINGTEVARRNAPASVQFNSTATQDRSTADAAMQEQIVIDSANLSSLVIGQNVLAIQGLNHSSSDDSFLIAPELISTSVGLNSPSYFATPTPGTVNTDPILGVLDRVSIDVPAGFYETSQTVTITSPDSVAEIYYTTDGSEPSATDGTLYSSPIPVSGTTSLRAIAVATDYVSLPSVTRTYLFLDDVLTQSNDESTPTGWPSSWGNNAVDYGIDPEVIAAAGAEVVKEALQAIPTLSLTTDLDNLFDSSTGIYANASQDGRDWERAASAEWINPDGSEGFQVNAGLRIRGGASRNASVEKHSFKLFFRGSYGDSTLDYPVHGDEGVSEFDKLDLRTPQNYSWSKDGNASNNFVGESIGRLNQIALGEASTRSTWIHLYINGQYWGMYQTQERADANFGESYFGGAAEDYDVLKPESGQSYEVIATDGDTVAYTDLWQQAAARASDGVTPNFINDEAYLEAQGKNSDGSRNTDYPVLVDVDNLIVYMMEIFRSGNFDAPISNFLGGNSRTNNFFAIRDRTGEEGFRYFVHDAEHSYRSVPRSGANALNANRNGPWNHANFDEDADYFNPQWLHQQLMANEEYRIRFADMVQLAFFNDGPLTTENQVALLYSERDGITEAVIGESARWGDSRTTTPLDQDDFLNAIDDLATDYLPFRNDIVIEQFRNTNLVLKDGVGDYTVSVPAPLFPDVIAPIFQIDGTPQHGGEVAFSSSLSFDSPDGRVYYMTDGSDPREVGGGVRAGAQFYDLQQSTQTLIADGDTWSYLDEGTQAPAPWASTNFNDSGWDLGASPLGFGETGQATTITSGPANNRFTTTYFRKDFSVDTSSSDISGVTISFRRDDGVALYLNGEEIHRDNLAPGPLTFETFAENAVATTTTPAEGDWIDYTLDPAELLLLVNGVNVLAAEVHQINLGSSDLDFSAELDVTSQPTASGIPITQPIGLAARTLDTNGIWSALQQADFAPPASLTDASHLRITEINYNPADPTAAELETKGTLDNDDFEFIEITNVHPTDTIDLSGITLAGGITYSFPDVFLDAGDRVVIVGSEVDFPIRYVDSGDSIKVLGEYSGGLKNSGEEILLLEANPLDPINPLEIMSVDYGESDPWPVQSDGKGATLVLIDPVNSPVERLGKPTSWSGSVLPGGTPGTASNTPAGIVINEVIAHTDLVDDLSGELNDPGVDSIEFYNPTDFPIDLTGWWLSDSSNPKFQLPTTIVQPGEFVVFDETDFNPNPTSPGPNDFALSASGGDEVYLTQAVGGDVTQFEAVAQFGATFNGQTLGLNPDGSRLVPLVNPSFGVGNGGYAFGDVVISEINYHPSDPIQAALDLDPMIIDKDLEFIEITNTTGATISLENWKLAGETNFAFDASQSIAGGSSLVILSFDPTTETGKFDAFRAHYSMANTVEVIGDFSGSLSNSHGLIKLQQPDSPPAGSIVIPLISIDELLYEDFAPWPAAADGTGASLTRIGASTLGAYTESWEAAAPTPGNVPLAATAQSVVINDGLDTRSTVSSVTVTFDEDLDLSADNFVLTNTDTGQQVTGITVATSTPGGQTIARLTFTDDPLVVQSNDPSAPSTLADGNYELSYRIAGFGGASAQVDSFFRKYGDADGDDNVGLTDFARFRGVFGGSDGETGLDANRDGIVGLQDFAGFRGAFGS